MTEVPLSVDQTLVDAGSPVATLYFPSSAVVADVLVRTDGQEIEIDTVGCEGVVGLVAMLTDSPQFTRSLIQIAGSAIAIDAGVVRDRVGASRPLLTLLKRAAMRVHVQAQQGVACLAHHGLSARLARGLLVTADRTGGPTFPMTQASMAVMTGTQRTSLHATAFDLKTRGLIQYARGQVTLLDRPALVAEACACYRTVDEIDSDLAGGPRRAFSI